MATTTNYGWTTPDDTALVKDGASAIRTLGSSVDTTVKALNPETTLGDISYRSSTANTKTRLAIGTTGQVLTVSGGVPIWASPAGGSLPTARAKATTAQNVAANTTTKVTLGTEDWDTDNCFASSRFTATTAGYYQVNSVVAVGNGSTAGIVYNYIYKNGSLYQANYTNTMLYAFADLSTMVYLAVNDYIELYVSHNVSGGSDLYGTSGYVFLDVTGIRS